MESKQNKEIADDLFSLFDNQESKNISLTPIAATTLLVKKNEKRGKVKAKNVVLPH